MKYYTPTQVKFYDADSGRYIGGIAYDDYIICGCCGGIFEIAEVLGCAPEGTEPIIDLEWTDIAHTIAGE